MTVRVRFAPSPTGFLHIGGVRTALFNYLFAKKNKGTFLLRIEDTDEERSTQASTDAIFEGMQWMNLLWDEGPMPDGTDKGPDAPYYQAIRADQGIYKKYIDQLLAEGKAYKCYCTEEELEANRQKCLAEHRPPKYSGKCAHLTEEEQKALEAQGRKYVIRFRMPQEGDVEWDDLIRGHVKFASKDLYDLVIQKTSGYPTYNFAVVVDDHLMRMTHVIRGDDHISNTPAQIQIYRALGWKEPIFAHLSMIHGPDGKKLSKRHGATNVVEFRNMGYLPEALKNYLALLGWATSDSQQIFAEGELEEKFDISGCQPSPAVMDPEKLNWMNGEYIRKTSLARLTDLALPFIEKAGINIQGVERERLEKIIGLEQEKYRLLTEVPDLIRFFFEEPVFEQEALDKVFAKPEAKAVLTGIAQVYEALPEFTDTALETAARAYAKENGYKAGQIFHPVRVAVSGRTHGPTLFKMLEYMGRETVLARLRKAVELCH